MPLNCPLVPVLSYLWSVLTLAIILKLNPLISVLFLTMLWLLTSLGWTVEFLMEATAHPCKSLTPWDNPHLSSAVHKYLGRSVIKSTQRKSNNQAGEKMRNWRRIQRWRSSSYFSLINVLERMFYGPCCREVCMGVDLKVIITFIIIFTVLVLSSQHAQIKVWEWPLPLRQFFLEVKPSFQRLTGFLVELELGQGSNPFFAWKDRITDWIRWKLSPSELRGQTHSEVACMLSGAASSG